MADGGTAEGFERLADGYGTFPLKATGRELDTAFALSTQRRLAGDMFLHLGTAQAAPSRDFLLRHALLRAVANAGLYAEAAAGNERPQGPLRLGLADPDALRRLRAAVRDWRASGEEIRLAETELDRWES